MEIDDRYDGDYIYEKSKYYYNSSTEKGLKFISNTLFNEMIIEDIILFLSEMKFLLG